MWQEIITNLPSPRVVTIIGGGGKTSLMNYLLATIENAVATTTTKLFYQPNCVLVSTLRDCYQALNQCRPVVLVTGYDKENAAKVVGLPASCIDNIARKYPKLIVIVEGDGAAGRPLKGYHGHEPVIPSSTKLVIPVIGIDCVGALLTDKNVHRAGRVAELTGAKLEMPVTTAIITQLLFHKDGGLRNCPPGCQVIPFINKVESADTLRQAYELANTILAGRYQGVERVIVGSMRNAEFRVVV